MLKSLLVYSAFFFHLPRFISRWVFLGKVFNEAKKFIQLVSFLVYVGLYIKFSQVSEIIVRKMYDFWIRAQLTITKIKTMNITLRFTIELRCLNVES